MNNNKVLTISIAAYNVEKTLGQALESCVVPGIMDDLEVLVINDGSDDGTAETAEDYMKRYPGTFRLINKKNGGYGSTVNCSMKEASGRFFKLLDGDDWFESESLRKLVLFLRNCDADVVLNGRIDVDSRGIRKLSKTVWQTKYGEKYHDQTIPLTCLEPFIYGIWMVTYRTAILKEHPFYMPEKQLYTDRVFICLPLPHIRTVAVQNYGLYCYRTGDAGQSTSRANRIRHYKDAVEGFEYILSAYEKINDMPAANERFLNLRIAEYYNNVLKTIFMLPASRKWEKEIRRLDLKIKELSKTLYDCCGDKNRMLRMFRKYSYHLYWARKLKKTENWQ